MPNLLSLTQFRGVRDNTVNGETKDLTWEALTRGMQKFQVLTNKKEGKAWSPVTFVKSLAGYTFKEEVEEVKEVTGEIIKLKLWENPVGQQVLTTLQDSILRRDINVRQVFMAVLDLDHQQEPPETLLAPWKDLNYIFHTTYSHNPEENDGRYRLIIPFAEPVTAEEFREIWPVLYERSGHRADGKCKNLSRVFFLPAHHPDRQNDAFVWTSAEGKYLTVTKKDIQATKKTEETKKGPKAAAKKPPPRNTTPYPERGDFRTLDGVGWFQAHGMFIGPAGNTPRGSKYWVKCPWAHEHTGGISDKEDTVLYEDPGRWPTFACSHTHCDGRDILQVNELWGDINAFCKEKLSPRVLKTQLQQEVKTAIRCLGYDDQKRYWYQCSETDSLTKLKADQHKELNLYSITGDMDYWFSKYGDDEGKLNWKRAALDLINRGNRAGPVRPDSILRGSGVMEDEGRIVAHLGRALLVDGVSTPITSIKSAFIYERRWPEIKLRIPATLAEAQKVFHLVERLSIPKASERVLLAGQLVAGYLSGILEYRPHCWLVGMPDSGKSATMREIIARLWTPIGGLYLEEKTTSAGIRQTLMNNAVPVAIDEAEAHGKEEISRIAGLVTIARSASSTGEDGGSRQGTAGGEAKGFRVRSCFIFASISPGLLNAQDKQRFSIINFRSSPDSIRTWPLFKADIRKTLTPEYVAAFFHRAVTMSRVILENIDVFYSVLTTKLPTVTARFCHHVGGLLACAYSYFSDEVVPPEKAWAFYESLGDWEDYRLEKFEENNAHQVYSLLMTHQIQDGIHRRTIAELIESAVSPVPLAEDSGRILRRYGIRVDKIQRRVFIANSHPTLVDIMSARGVINHNIILREYPAAEVARDPIRLDSSSATYRGIWLPYNGGEQDLGSYTQTVSGEAGNGSAPQPPPGPPDKDPELAF